MNVTLEQECAMRTDGRRKIVIERLRSLERIEERLDREFEWSTGTKFIIGSQYENIPLTLTDLHKIIRMYKDELDELEDI